MRPASSPWCSPSGSNLRGASEDGMRGPASKRRREPHSASWHRFLALLLGIVGLPDRQMSRVQFGSQKKKARITRPFSSYGSGDPTFIVGRHSVRFGDGLEGAKYLHPGESRDGTRGDDQVAKPQT